MTWFARGMAVMAILRARASEPSARTSSLRFASSRTSNSSLPGESPGSTVSRNAEAPVRSTPRTVCSPDLSGCRSISIENPSTMLGGMAWSPTLTWPPPNQALPPELPTIGGNPNRKVMPSDGSKS